MENKNKKAREFLKRLKRARMILSLKDIKKIRRRFIWKMQLTYGEITFKEYNNNLKSLKQCKSNK